MKVGDLVKVTTPTHFTHAGNVHPWHGLVTLVVNIEYHHSGDVYKCLRDGATRDFHDNWLVPLETL